MIRRVLPLLMGSLLLLLGCGSPTGLQPSESCSGQPANAIVTFEDANLEAQVRGALSVGAQDDLTCGLVSGETVVTARSAGIESLVGIQNLTSLRRLLLDENSISDISALSGLTNLADLLLDENSISDISALSGLTNLGFLGLSNNPNLTDIQPLLDNTGIDAGDTVDLQATNVSCTDVDALRAKQVHVFTQCP